MITLILLDPLDSLSCISNTVIVDTISKRTPLSISLQDCFKLDLQFRDGYHLFEGVNVARAANIMTLQAEDINEIWRDKDIEQGLMLALDWNYETFCQYSGYIC